MNGHSQYKFTSVQMDAVSSCTNEPASAQAGGRAHQRESAHALEDKLLEGGERSQACGQSRGADVLQVVLSVCVRLCACVPCACKRKCVQVRACVRAPSRGAALIDIRLLVGVRACSGSLARGVSLGTKLGREMASTQKMSSPARPPQPRGEEMEVGRHREGHTKAGGRAYNTSMHPHPTRLPAFLYPLLHKSMLPCSSHVQRRARGARARVARPATEG